ncbi:MAG TPA: prepilin-type N-terminal cleavage/methylation domain-containing protein [Phycisphaerales bacterium]|nr:prepilin-type N-terminal cleavage/methylation domain-containing protein [Phycisphaerales bacterium]
MRTVNRIEHPRDSSQSLLVPGVVRGVGRAFTLVEILISIMILALGVLGLGVLFPVVIREQRMGVDASTGVVVAGTAKDTLTAAQWSRALPSGGLAATPAPPAPPPLPAPQPRPGACCRPVTNPSCTIITAAQCATQNGHFFGEGTVCRAAPCSLGHPAIVAFGVDGATEWMWDMLRNRERYSPTFAGTISDGLGRGYSVGSRRATGVWYGEGQWFTRLIEPTTGVAKIGFPNSNALVTGLRTVTFVSPPDVTACVDLPVQQRLYPQSADIDPQFVWDFAVQRVSGFNYINHPPQLDDLRAVVFVRRVDSRIRPPIDGATGRPKSVLRAILDGDRLPIGEDGPLPTPDAPNYGNPTFDGTNGAGGLKYSGIHSCEVEFWYNPAVPAMNHTDRLYIPLALVDTGLSAQLPMLFAQMKQPGQKLVDNLGNIYTVIGFGNEPGVAAQTFDGVAGGDYIRVDPPIGIAPERAAPATQMVGYGSPNGEVRRAMWSVSFTPQVPVAVTIVDLVRRSGQ